MTTLAHFQNAGCRPVRTAAFASSTMLSLSNSQSRRTAPKHSLPPPEACLKDCENRALSTACSVTDWCACPAGGNSMYWSYFFRWKDDFLSGYCWHGIWPSGFCGVWPMFGGMWPVACGPHGLPAAPMPWSGASPGIGAQHSSPDVTHGFADYALSFRIYLPVCLCLFAL